MSYDLMHRHHWMTISRILWRDWNPIGRDVPEDEYDANVPKLIRLLDAGADVEEIATFLGDFRETVVGSSDRPADTRIAQMLYDLPLR